MTDPQIEALAREYAEEMNKDIPLSNDIKSLRESAIRLSAEGMEKRLRWLLRRYCLVEKEALLKWIDPKDKLPEIRERVLICEKVANQYKVFIGKRVPSPCTDGWEWNQSKKENVAAWMPLPKYSPSIAKEMKE